MRKLLFTIILLNVCLGAVMARSGHMTSKLKEDYYRELASREGVDPEMYENGNKIGYFG